MFIGVSACSKKKLPAEPNQDPVFYLKGDIDGKAINFEAGNLNYFMKTSFDWDTTNVCVFKGDLSEQSCNKGCAGYGIKFFLNDSKITTPNTGANLGSVLRIGEYIFNDKDLPSMYYRITLNPLSSNMGQETFNWIVEGSNVFATSNKYCLTTILNASNVYSITLGYDNGIGCGSSHQNVFAAGNPLQTTVVGKRNLTLPGAVYDFSCQATGMPPYQYFWDFGDGTVSNVSNPNHSFAVVLNGRTKIKLRLIDANKDTCLSYYQVQNSGDPTCDANFTSSFTPIPNYKAFSSITLIVTDPNGIVYTSKDVIQPATSSFQVIEVADYLENETNHPTKRLKAKVNCILVNGNKQIKLSNAELSIALAYPN